MKPLTIKNFIPGIAWFFIVLVLICMPGEDIPDPTVWFEWMKLIRVDKLVHTGIFALLVFLFIRPVGKHPAFSTKAKWNYFVKVALAGCIWGLTTELIQKFFVPSRNFDLVDCAADSIGAVIAFLFSWIFFLKRPSKNQPVRVSETL